MSVLAVEVIVRSSPARCDAFNSMNTRDWPDVVVRVDEMRG